MKSEKQTFFLAKPCSEIKDHCGLETRSNDFARLHAGYVSGSRWPTGDEQPTFNDGYGAATTKLTVTTDLRKAPQSIEASAHATIRVSSHLSGKLKPSKQPHMGCR